MTATPKNECPFCNVPAERVIDASELAVAIDDAFPVSRGYALVIPRRHVESFFDLTAEELAAILTLLHRAKDRLDHRQHPDGYNVGVNIGTAAGQTIGHVHVHLIPRHAGDVEEPEGGVRNVIPGKGPYSRGVE